MKRTPRAPAIPSAERDLIENHQKAIRVDVRSLRNFLRQVRRELRLEQQGVGVRFINDSEMTRLNRTYRMKKGTTDVLSFPDASQWAAADRGAASTERRVRPRAPYLGDIAISPKVARRNAKASGHALPHELRILILHGVLHLLGYDHETDRGQMDRIEAKLRRRMGLA
jgi:probable rRNA maturation factor